MNAFPGYLFNITIFNQSIYFVTSIVTEKRTEVFLEFPQRQVQTRMNV